MKGFFKHEPNGPTESLEYEERNGELYYEYHKDVSVPTKHHAAVYEVYESYGKIPKIVVKKGTSAIEKYVEEKIKTDVAKQVKKRKKEAVFEKNPDFPIETKYDGKVLKGKIISIEDTAL